MISKETPETTPTVAQRMKAKDEERAKLMLKGLLASFDYNKVIRKI